jgi:hypothetical protein
MVTSSAVTEGRGATTTTAPDVSYTLTGTVCGRMVRSDSAVASSTSWCVGWSVGVLGLMVVLLF